MLLEIDNYKGKLQISETTESDCHDNIRLSTAASCSKQLNEYQLTVYILEDLFRHKLNA